MWTKLYDSILSDRKLSRLARRLDTSICEATGIVVRMWALALRDRPDGVFSDLTPEEIGDEAGWPDIPADRVVEALTQEDIRLLDIIHTDKGTYYAIHHWDRYALGPKESERKRNWRQRKKLTSQSKRTQKPANPGPLPINSDYVQKIIPPKTLEDIENRSRLLDEPEFADGTLTGHGRDIDGTLTGQSRPREEGDKIRDQSSSLRSEDSRASPSQRVSAPPEPPLLVFPCKKSRGVSTWDLTQEFVQKLTEAYEGVDVMKECIKAHARMETGALKRTPTPQGMPRFLHNWIANAQKWGPESGVSVVSKRSERVSRALDTPLSRTMPPQRLEEIIAPPGGLFALKKGGVG